MKFNVRKKKEYLRSINKFFAFSDKNNNDRIYFEITKKNNKNFKSILFNVYLFILFLIYIILKLSKKNFVFI